MILAEKKQIDWNAAKEELGAALKALELSSSGDAARMQEVFQRRAERLAGSDAAALAAGDSNAVLVLGLDGESYGIELQYVARVFPTATITPLPGSPDSLLGVANLQGEVRSVLDLRRLLLLPEGDKDTNRYILLLCHDGRHLGLQVEQIEGIRQVDTDRLIEAEAGKADQRGGFVRGVMPDTLILLRAAEIVRIYRHPDGTTDQEHLNRQEH